MSALDLRSLPDRLADLLRERILAGEAEPGRPIRQDALAAELGVSKIPLREAMARLEREGLLRAEANRGWFVRSLSADEAREIYALRLGLEPKLAAAAAAAADEAERRAARAALDRLERATSDHESSVGAMNRAYHLALVRPARQPVTFDIVERLHVLADRYVAKHLEPLGRDARANAEHRALLDAWVERDGARVAELLHSHLRATLDDLERQLGSAVGHEEGADTILPRRG
jgi:DNA-binding GntR family transcriptional regulator